MSDKVLTVYNHHIESCGNPPGVIDRDEGYRGYYVNVHGEQWVFCYDKSSGAVLRGGDIEWESPVPVDIENGKVDVMLNDQESTWLTACILTVRQLISWERGREKAMLGKVLNPSKAAYSIGAPSKSECQGTLRAKGNKAVLYVSVLGSVLESLSWKGSRIVLERDNMRYFLRLSEDDRGTVPMKIKNSARLLIIMRGLPVEEVPLALLKKDFMSVSGRVVGNFIELSFKS